MTTLGDRIWDDGSFATVSVPPEVEEGRGRDEAVGPMGVERGRSVEIFVRGMTGEAAREMIERATRTVPFPVVLVRGISGFEDWPRRFMRTVRTSDDTYVTVIYKKRVAGSFAVRVHPRGVGAVDGSAVQRVSDGDREVLMQDAPLDGAGKPMTPVRRAGKLVAWRAESGEVIWRMI